MVVSPQDQVMQRLQGIKDSRSLVGQMARGNNVYNSTSQAAQSGPGGPNMGRPPVASGVPSTAVNSQAVQAVQNLAQQNQVPVAPNPVNLARQQQMQQLQQRVQPQGMQNVQTNVASQGQNRAMTNLAQAAMQAAAQRKMQRSR